MGAESRRVIIWELGRWGIRGKSNGIQHSPWEINMVFFVKRARIRVSAWHPSVQSSSVAQSCPTLCDPMNRSMPGLPVHHHLCLSSLRLMSIKSVMPSRHLILCYPLLLLLPIPPSIRVFSNESTLCMRCPKLQL